MSGCHGGKILQHRSAGLQIYQIRRTLTGPRGWRGIWTQAPVLEVFLPAGKCRTLPHGIADREAAEPRKATAPRQTGPAAPGAKGRADARGKRSVPALSATNSEFFCPHHPGLDGTYFPTRENHTGPSRYHHPIASSTATGHPGEAQDRRTSVGWAGRAFA